MNFITFGTFAFVLSGLAAAIASLQPVSEVVNFTWFTPAQTQLAVYGFFAMTMFGAIDYIVPWLLGVELAPARVNCISGSRGSGIAVYVLSLGAGGVQEGNLLNGPKPFMDIVNINPDAPPDEHAGRPPCWWLTSSF